MFWLKAIVSHFQIRIESYWYQGWLENFVDDDHDSDHEIHSDDYHASLMNCDDIDLLKKSGLLDENSSFECIEDYYLYYCPFCPGQYDTSI